MNIKSHIIVCSCSGPQNLSESPVVAVRDHCLSYTVDESLETGVIVTLIEDLCHWAAKEKDKLHELLQLDGDLTVIASCSQRAVLNLFRYAGFELKNDAINRFISYREHNEDDICTEVDTIVGPSSSITCLNDIKLGYKPANMAWYPVLDYERCTDCRQCENFCLFGVYKNENGKVLVNKPVKCKPYCPACSKICPSSAIIFPKHEKPEINGSVIKLDSETDSKTISQIKGNDLMGFLRGRSSIADKAAELDIPTDLINSLPPDQLANIINKKKELEE